MRGGNRERWEETRFGSLYKEGSVALWRCCFPCFYLAIMVVVISFSLDFLMIMSVNAVWGTDRRCIYRFTSSAGVWAVCNFEIYITREPLDMSSDSAYQGIFALQGSNISYTVKI